MSWNTKRAPTFGSGQARRKNEPKIAQVVTPFHRIFHFPIASGSEAMIASTSNMRFHRSKRITRFVARTKRMLPLYAIGACQCDIALV
ncbi:hypothetical protein [Burkholderia sp. F1]|uniref:hypothetical protein n=1 Tax=Burkholderia sp. F1 TaxID=3366817 RepID=UPI003D72FA7A